MKYVMDSHRQHSKPIERKLPSFFVSRRHLLAKTQPAGYPGFFIYFNLK
jgi:hypothetical protein